MTLSFVPKVVLQLAGEAFKIPLQSNGVFIGVPGYTDFEFIFPALNTHPELTVGHEKGDEETHYHEETGDPDQKNPGVSVGLESRIVLAFKFLQKKYIGRVGRRIELRVLFKYAGESLLDHLRALEYPEALFFPLGGVHLNEGGRTHAPVHEIIPDAGYLKMALFPGKRELLSHGNHHVLCLCPASLT